jgi:hypothetical protein
MDTSIGMGKSVVLPVGERYHLKRGKDHIIYAGMPSDSVYSVVQIKASGYQGYAWHLYYPKRQQDITVDGVDIHVIRVSPEEIELRVT